MKNTLALLTFAFMTTVSSGQKLLSGDYDAGLKLAYDSKADKVTGYFEDYTGWDDKTNNPQFSCVFYMEGNLATKTVKITTYYPNDKSDDVIEGTLEIVNNKAIKIQLSGEHGGCWNVQHFVDEPVAFALEKSQSWIQIRYITVEKAYFYSDKSNEKKQKAYLIKNDIVAVETIDGEWAYCTFYGKKPTKGWIKIDELNSL